MDKREVPRQPEPFPVPLLIGYAFVAIACAVCAALVHHDVKKMAYWQYLVDVLVAAAVAAAAIPVLHEGMHWVLYRASDCRPWFGAGGSGTKRAAPWVAAEEPVPRRLLQVQLRIVPLAALILSVVTTGVVSLATGTGGWHVAVGCTATGLALLASGWTDLHQDIPGAPFFWDYGNDYLKAPSQRTTRQEP